MLTHLFDLKTFLRQHTTIEGQHDGGSGLEYVIRCGCTLEADKEAHLWVNLEKGVGKCWICGKHYSLIDLVRHVTGLSYLDATRLIEEGVTKESRLLAASKSLQPEVDSETKDVVISLPDEYIPIMESADIPEYLVKRGLTLKECKRWQIGFCQTGLYRDRAIIPVYSVSDELVSFVARYFGTPPSGVRKVLYPKGSRISKVLYDEARALRCQTVVVCEGVFDAFAIDRASSTEWWAVCLFGKHASSEQVGRLASLGQDRSVVIMLDSDALEECRELAVELAEICPRVYVASDYRAKDPGEASLTAIERAIEGACQVSSNRVIDRLQPLLTAL